MNPETTSLLVCLTLFIVFGLLGLLVLVIIYTNPRGAKKLHVPIEEKASVPYKFAEIEEPKAERLPYRVRDNFLSEAEHSFYLVLRHTLDHEFTICPRSGCWIFFTSRATPTTIPLATR
jgi:hypothetical protein